MNEKKEKRRDPEQYEPINPHLYFLMMFAGSFVSFLCAFDSPLYSKIGTSIMILGFTCVFIYLDFDSMRQRRLMIEDLMKGCWPEQEEEESKVD